MAKSLKKLELTKPEFSVRAQNFFNLMNVKEFQQQFFDNPTKFASQELGISLPSATKISQTNQSIFKLLSDPNFNSWATDFQKKLENEFPEINKSTSVTEIIEFAKAKTTQEQFKENFIQSIIHHLNPSSYEEIIKGGVLKPGVINAEGDVAVVLLTFVAVVVILVVAAGVAKPNEALSRITINTVVNQLQKQHLDIIKNKMK